MLGQRADRAGDYGAGRAGRRRRAGFGPLDAADSRALAGALAPSPATRWCLTFTGAAGQAIAHGCARAGPGGPSLPPSPCNVSAWLARTNLAWLGPGECDHRHESPGYRPSAALAHLVQIRQQTCTAPGCWRPATRCDGEHTVAYHRGGRTCLCNLGPCCRRHHRAKQTAGWRLEQPRPGIFTWAIPFGRRYSTGPAEYPVA